MLVFLVSNALARRTNIFVINRGKESEEQKLTKQ